MKDLGGRPTVMTKEALQKLEEGAEWSLNDRELALHAGIGESTLRLHYKQNPALLERINALRARPSIMAKRIVHTNLAEGDGDTAKWQLKNRNNTEYSEKQVTETKEDLTVKFSDLKEVDGADADKIVGFVLGRIKK